MGSMGMPYGLQAMLKDGHKHFSGVDEAVIKNIEACRGLSNITRTSLGPNGPPTAAVLQHSSKCCPCTLNQRNTIYQRAGMNKMVINHLDKLFVTSDTATIVTELEVEHPAAKLLVIAAKAQEAEIGDATNLVSHPSASQLPLICNMLKASNVAYATSPLRLVEQEQNEGSSRTI